MDKTQYIITDNNKRFFKKITRQNKILFTTEKEDATHMNYEDTQELIPLIEFYSGRMTVAVSIEDIPTLLE